MTSNPPIPTSTPIPRNAAPTAVAMHSVDIPQPPPGVVPTPPSPHPVPPSEPTPPEVIEPPLPGQVPVQEPISPTGGLSARRLD